MGFFFFSKNYFLEKSHIELNQKKNFMKYGQLSQAIQTVKRLRVGINKTLVCAFFVIIYAFILEITIIYLK